jgi:hypothetical protein
MDAMTKLLAIEEIKQLKARYFRCVDTFNLEGWLSVFTDNAKLAFDLSVGYGASEKPQVYRVEGKKGIAEFWAAGTSRYQTVHHGHMPEIEIISDTEAKGVWAMEDIVETPGDILHGYGHYWETYRKVDGKWLIETLHLTRTRVTQSYKARQAPLT